MNFINITNLKKLTARMRQLSLPASAFLFLITGLVLSLLLEVGVFQFRYFQQFSSDYPETTLDLSTLDGWNGEALALLPENPSVSFQNLSVPVRSVTVRTSGPAAVLSGNIGICDEASAVKTVGAASFQVNPGGTENTFTARIDSRGTLSRLRITFTDTLTEPVFLLSVTLNARQPLSINGLRVLLLTLVLTALFLVFRFRLYETDYQPARRSHRLLNLAVLLLCLLISGGVFYGSDSSHALLRPYPTLEEIRSPEMVVDAYMQQLDAFEKGQLELDLDVNPELEALDNPYDKGERDKKEITCHWDRAYYNGKYYSYFGLAPLFMVYYPVYLLTGMLPTTEFAGGVLAVFALLALFLAVQGLLKLFRPRVNLLLFLTGELAVTGGSFLWMLQASASSFYYLPLLAAAGWLAAFTALASFAVSTSTARKRSLLFFLCGLSVVMLVLSRPNSVLLAMAFAAPLFLQLLFDRKRSPRERFLESALPFLIPVVLGAAVIMYYNYLRFGSFFEFGTSYQLTESDIRYNQISFSLHHLSSMLYHYFAEPFVSLEFFPFLRFTTEKCVDFGNYLYQEYSVGLFQMPLNLGIFLAPCLLYQKKAVSQNSRNLQKPILLLLIPALLILGYLDFLLGGIHIRYVCDLSLVMSLTAFFLILSQIHYDGTRSARILYIIVLFGLLLTVSRGLLLIFSNETNSILLKNPDFYLRISHLFHS